MEHEVDKHLFCWSGEPHQREIYMYSECGLDNIALLNGYTVRDFEGEEYVSIHDVDGLHQAISKHLVMHRKVLSGAEIKFIRKTMDLTQKELADKLGNEPQTVARWEKGLCPIPGPSGKLLRAVFLAGAAETPDDMNVLKMLLVSLLDEIDSIDSLEHQPAQFEFQEHWLEAA